MQHILRCWERQSDGTEYMKTIRRPRPPPQEPYLSPALGPSGLASPTHSKISTDTVAQPGSMTIVFPRIVTTAPPRQTSQCGGDGSWGALCRWEKEVLALGPKTSPGQGAHLVFSAGEPII